MGSEIFYVRFVDNKVSRIFWKAVTCSFPVKFMGENIRFRILPVCVLYGHMTAVGIGKYLTDIGRFRPVFLFVGGFISVPAALQIFFHSADPPSIFILFHRYGFTFIIDIVLINDTLY